MENKPIKIDLFLPRHTGGVTVWGDNLTEELRSNEVKVKVWRGEFKVILGSIFGNGNIIHTTVPMLFYKNKPIVASIHGIFDKEKNFWSRFYNSLLNKANIITVPSEYLKNALMIKREMRVISNSINLEQFPFYRHEINQNSLHFLTITNFNFEDKCKRIIEIIEIINSYNQRQKTEKVSLDILGDGINLEKYKKTISNIAKFPVIFHGFQPTKKFYKNSDIFIYLSDQDTGPLVMLEAMASGLPVIINDVGMASEVVKDGVNGFIANNEKDFLRVITRLTTDESKYKSIATEGRKTIEKTYNWKQNIDAYIKIYRELVK